jgi:hypothetical protein
VNDTRPEGTVANRLKRSRLRWSVAREGGYFRRAYDGGGLEDVVRRISVGLYLSLVVVACSGEDLTLGEYSTQGQAITMVMEERIQALDSGMDFQTASSNDVDDYWDRRVDARVDALERLHDLDPPATIADLHEQGMDLFSDLVEGEKAMAARIASFDTVTEPSQWWDTAEGKSVQVVNEQIFVLCNQFQATYDATIARVVLSDTPWIPDRMKEVIQIDVGC